MLKKIKQIFELVTLIIGTIIGAGFISGAELLHFFPTNGYFYYLIFAGILFIVSFSLLYTCGRKYDGFLGVLQTVFKKSGMIVHICMLLSSIILCGSMLAGFVSSLQLFFGVQRFLPLYSLLLLIVVFLIAFKGVKAVLQLNAVLVPFMVILVLCFYKLPTTWQSVQMPTFSVVLNIILFVAFNLFLAAPVVCDLGAKHKQEELKRQGQEGMIEQKKIAIFQERNLSIFLATAIIILTASTILENIIRCNGAMEQTLPFLYTIQGKIARSLFAISAIGGILTTLFSAYYTLHSSVNTIKYALFYRLLFAICAYLLSIMGLKYIIKFCYPVIGSIGILFLTILAIHLYMQRKASNRKSSNRDNSYKNKERSACENTIKPL